MHKINFSKMYIFGSFAFQGLLPSIVKKKKNTKHPPPSSLIHNTTGGAIWKLWCVWNTVFVELNCYHQQELKLLLFIIVTKDYVFMSGQGGGRLNFFYEQRAAASSQHKKAKIVLHGVRPFSMIYLNYISDDL